MSELLTYWHNDFETGLAEHLVGHKIVGTHRKENGNGWLMLDNGVQLEVSGSEYDCCSSCRLTGLAQTDNIITAVKVGHADEVIPQDGWNDTVQRCYIQVITDGGPINIVTADTDPSNGYYLNGYSLDVTVHFPEETTHNA